ncbi:hypothetical protein CLU83_2966 [Flavobacterium sp. 1]|uniref:hypothetical protein n=1 Tax=Flavobacterium sp. 1 TaxID=2035200 RepID=UPI000C240D73|nr:hypothetical protein [Flavobacterium sp. 1]PJJ09601.1 hypothetical protein CLU83_2966 [Flavobacterium sp. 1]
MKELKEGDFATYKLEDPSSINREKEVTVQITKTPNDNYLFYEALRLDNNKPIPKNKEKDFNYEIIEIGNHHFKGLKATFQRDYYSRKNKTLYLDKWNVKNLNFITISCISINIFQQIDFLDYYFVIDNSNILNQEYFNYFFKEIDGHIDLKDNLEKINNINELFDKLDLINYNYNKKEIVLHKELESKK